MTVRLRRGVVLDANSVMPATPRRQRHESPRTGDAKGAIRRAKGGYLDLNVTIAAQTLWALHWTIPARGGFRYVRLPDGRYRHMTPGELVRPASRWGVEGIKSWRRKLSPREAHAQGRKYERVLTLDEALGEAVRVGTCLIMETKSPAFGTDQRWFVELGRLCRKHDHPRWAKTLGTMSNARGKVALAHNRVFLAVIWGSRVKGRKARLARTARLSAGWTIKPYATW